MTSVAHPTLPHCPIPMIGGTRSTRSQSECSPSRRGPMGPQSTAAILRYCFGRISAGSREKRALQVSSFELGPCGFADHRYAFECIGAHPDRFLPWRGHARRGSSIEYSDPSRFVHTLFGLLPGRRLIFKNLEHREA